MIIRLLIWILFVVIASATAHGQVSCLRILEQPPPDFPVHKIPKGQKISYTVIVEFLANGTLDHVIPWTGKVIPELDNSVEAAARRIKFEPKKVAGVRIPNKRDVKYHYSSSRGWVMSPGSGNCLTQDSELTAREEEILETTARKFISRLSAVHDFRPLIDAWFVSGFVPFYVNEYGEEISKTLFSQLSYFEKRRLFLARFNFYYLVSVIQLSEPEELECYNPDDPDCEARDRRSMMRVLPAKVVEKLLENENSNEKPLTTKGEVIQKITELEQFFELALPALRRLRLEETAEFKQSFSSFEDDYNVGFKIEKTGIDRTIIGSNRRVLISKNQPIYSVETPLLIRLDFVKHGSKFKLVNMGAGDGD